MNNNSEYEKIPQSWYIKIPSSWTIKKLKYITRARKGLSIDGCQSLLSVSERAGIVKSEDLRRSEGPLTRADNLIGYRLVSKGNLVNNIMLVWKKGLGVSPYNGIVSPAYSVYSFNEDCDPWYYNYLLRTNEMVSEFRRRSTGIVLSRLRLYDESFGDVQVFVPPLKEQKRISKFLNKKTSQIEKQITKIRGKIDILDERRQRLIDRYITNGIDSNVLMKDSGDPIIGSIPKHWKMQRLKYLVSHNSNTLPEDTDPDYQFHYVEIGDVEFKKGISIHEKITFCEAPSRARRVVEPDDVIFPTVSVTTRSIAIIPKIKDLVCSTGFCVLKCRSELLNHAYLSYLLKSDWFITRAVCNSFGVIYPGINPSRLLDIKVVLPPMSDQLNIVHNLNNKIVKIDNLVNKLNEQLILLSEYKESLIFSLVSGKIRVTKEIL